MSIFSFGPARIRSVRGLLSGSLNPDGLIDCIKFDIRFRRDHPDYFPYDGLYLFCGSQGSGKTLSMVQAAYKLACDYPRLQIVTNLILNNFPRPERIFEYSGDDCLDEYNNGEYGVLFLIDEIHTLYNSLQSRNIDPSVMAQICQQRKQRKIIMGTSQVFSRVAKPFREQCKVIVLCGNFLKYLQVNQVCLGYKCVDAGNGEMNAPVEYRRFWFHTPQLYLMYDTYAVITRNSGGDKRSAGSGGAEIDSERSEEAIVAVPETSVAKARGAQKMEVRDICKMLWRGLCRLLNKLFRMQSRLD